MKKETYTFAIMPSSGRRIKTFSISLRSIVVILASFVFIVVSSISTGSVLTWRQYIKQKRMADEAVQKYDTLCKELQDLRKSYMDFASILGIETPGSSDDSGKGGPEMPMITGVSGKELPNDSSGELPDDKAERILSALNEASSLRSDFEDLSKAVGDNMTELAMIPSTWPIKVTLGSRPWVSSGFGLRKSPFTRSWEMHEGIDIISPLDTPITSTADGIIMTISEDRFLGRYVEIRHNKKYTTAYCHMNSYADNIQIGTEVKRGEVIGYVGRSGRTTGCHVHYEVRVNGKQVNPIDYIMN